MCVRERVCVRVQEQGLKTYSRVREFQRMTNRAALTLTEQVNLIGGADQGKHDPSKDSLIILVLRNAMIEEFMSDLVVRMLAKWKWVCREMTTEPLVKAAIVGRMILIVLFCQTGDVTVALGPILFYYRG